MAVVVQSAFLIEVLALKPQWVFDFSNIEAADFAVGAVMRGPDDIAVRVGEFLRCAEVVELIVVGFGGFGTEAFEHCQRPEAVWLVEVTAVLILVMLGNQLVALPEELRGDAVDGFADTPPKRVIAVARALAVGFCDANQPVLAVVAVFGNELLTFAASFTDQVSEGVIVVVVVALHHQAIARHDVGAGAVLHQQVARRVVGEAFLQVLGMVGAGQAAERVVVVAVFAFASVE